MRRSPSPTAKSPLCDFIKPALNLNTAYHDRNNPAYVSGGVFALFHTFTLKYKPVIPRVR